MILNYVKIAIRNLQRQPGYTLLNILGLSVGMAASLFILLYLQHELSYDQHHERAGRVFRISSDIKEPDNAFRWAVTQYPLGEQLKMDYPEVEQYARLNTLGRTQFRLDDKEFFIEDVFTADSTFFELFTFSFLKGDPATALHEPNSIVLSRSEAEKLFGEDDPMDKLLRTNREQPYKVTGVYEDMPSNSHFIAKALVSLNSFPGNTGPGSWGGFGIYTYVLLNEPESARPLEQKLQEIIDKHVAVIFDPFNITVTYELINIRDIHLTSTFEGEPQPTGTMAYIYIFTAIGIFMLLIASINYMNLATARSARRALEVGMRKVLGSYRSQLITQFLAESVLFTLIALVISLGLVALTVPYLNRVFDLSLRTSMLLEPTVLLALLGIVGLVGIVGGSYPAFFLSGFQPIAVLKGRLRQGGGNVLLRKGLVVVQFMITIFMLIGTGIIYDQLNYVRSKDLGFDKAHVLSFDLAQPAMREKWGVLRERMLQHPGVLNAGTSTSAPGRGFGKNVMEVETEEGDTRELGIDFYAVDFDFFHSLGIDSVQGRLFSRAFSTDSTQAALVNEAMVHRMGWENPLGKKFQFPGRDTTHVARVIGVVKNFHQRSLYDEIEALLFLPRFNNSLAHVKLSGHQLKEAIAHVGQSWEEVFPTVPFEYEFLDEHFQQQYEEDQRRGRLFLAFSGLIIFIACLGLLGLASFTTEQRNKEVGIRKVVGASTRDILVLLTKDFMLLVVLAAVPAFGIAWYFMREWLSSFAYHTDMNYVLYVLALVLTLLITLLTTGYHALKAANSDPVEALKYE